MEFYTLQAPRDIGPGLSNLKEPKTKPETAGCSAGNNLFNRPAMGSSGRGAEEFLDADGGYDAVRHALLSNHRGWHRSD